MLTDDEIGFIYWYRSLNGEEQLAVRQFIHSGDDKLLICLGKRSECLDRLPRLSITQGDDEREFFRAQII